MGDQGYFPAGESVLRRVHEERIVGLLYGQRALLMQATHPLAFAGLLQDSTGADMPFKRLVSTAKTMERIYFGTCADADRITGAIHKMHSRVTGTIAEPAGPHPAGSSYAALRPDFLLWILACLADSALDLYERFTGRLSDADRERFWQDYLILGELFALPREHAPADFAAFRAYLRERLASDELHVSERARHVATTVSFDLPVPAHRKLGLAVVNHAITGSLPPRVRELYGLRWTRVDALRLRALTAGLRASAAALPDSLRTGSCARDYELVARGERARAARGKQVSLAA